MPLASNASKYGPWILVGLILLGIGLQVLDIVDWQNWLNWGRAQRDNAWLILLLIAAQVLLFMFALPGSTVLWLTAPLYTPLITTIILTTGATLGAVAAYFLAQHLGHGWRQRLSQHPGFKRLQTQGDFLSLLVLRLLPGFPHSVINYGAGMLGLPLTGFIFASILGISLKSALYASTIYNAVEATRPAELLEFKTLFPLLILASLALLARLLQHRYKHPSSH